MTPSLFPALAREIGNLLPNNRRQRRTCYALCHILYPVSAAHTSIFRMDSNSTSYSPGHTHTSSTPRRDPACVVVHHSSMSSLKDASIACKSSAACYEMWPSCMNSNLRPSCLPVPAVAPPSNFWLNRTHTSPLNPLFEGLIPSKCGGLGDQICTA